MNILDCDESFLIEKLSKDDYGIFTEMFLDYFINDENVKYDVKLLEKNLIQNTILKQYEKQVIFIDILKSNKKCLGFIIYQIDSENSDWNEKPGQGFIREFYISPNYRRCGLGSYLLSNIENKLMALGVSKVYLTASNKEYVKTFYIKNGYLGTNENSEFNKLEYFEKNICKK